MLIPTIVGQKMNTIRNLSRSKSIRRPIEVLPEVLLVDLGEWESRYACSSSAVTALAVGDVLGLVGCAGRAETTVVLGRTRVRYGVDRPFAAAIVWLPGMLCPMAEIEDMLRIVKEAV
jgi:hypothetical protein